MGWHLAEPWWVLVTLSKLVNAPTIVTGLGAEVQWLMTEEVTPHEQVRLCCSASSFELVVRVIPSAGWYGDFFLLLQELMRTSMEKS